MTGGRLSGKVAVITGAAMGLGAADARRFVAEGAQVVLTDIVDDVGTELAEELGQAATYRHLDVRSDAAWEELVAEVSARFGRIDVLVNNAGVVELDTPENIREDDYRKVMAVGIDGVIWGCKHAIRAMRRVGNSGSIVNMSSIAAAQGEPINASYTAAKGAVDAYSRMVAVYCGQAGLPIRCNSVLPNGIVTPMVQSVPGKRAAAGPEAGLLSSVPGQGNDRGEPDDVAALVAFLASDESRWINGQSILVDNAASITKGSVPTLPA